MPIVLEIWLYDLVSVVIFQESILLPITRNISQQQIGKRIAGTNVRVRRVKGEIARYRPGTQFTSEFVLLPKGGVGSKQQIVLAYDLGHVVAICVGRICVVRTIWDVSWVLAEP